MVRFNIFDVRQFCKAIGRQGRCFYPETGPKNSDLAFACSCLHICASFYFNCLLQKAWFVNSLKVKSDILQISSNRCLASIVETNGAEEHECEEPGSSPPCHVVPSFDNISKVMTKEVGMVFIFLRQFCWR